MLAKKHRLSKTKDIVRVLKQGIFAREKFLTVRVAPNQLSVSRFAFIVSGKISKKSTTRNRIKRWLRESVRKSMKHVKTGFDVVARPHPEITEKQYREVEEAVGRILKKVNVLA